MNVKRMTKRTEFYVMMIIIAFCMLVQVRSGQFFTGNNIVDLLRSMTIPIMFCIGEMMVLLSGGVDCSFPAIASLSMYFVCTKMDGMFSNPLPYFLVAILLGLCMGALNGFIVAKFKFPALIVTLGTSALFLGIMQGVLGSSEYPLTKALYSLGSVKLLTAKNPQSGLTSDLPIHFIFMIVLVVLAWLLLNKTMIGRGIYAVGGDEVAATRAGFNVFGTRIFIFCLSGALAGFIGVSRASMLLTVSPNNMIGMDMDVIAACVLGGVSLVGGRGSIVGAILGTILMTIVSNSLILLGVPTQWSRVFTGIIIIVGTAVSAIQEQRRKKKLFVAVSEKPEV
ncbi:MAG: ABC transporter permease [Lacrimispora sp.]|uniref:ABC transporter permease n=1 Tax=Lacrimispora sp. TaxID=2719234 RepID=UPI0039E287A0